MLCCDTYKIRHVTATFLVCVHGGGYYSQDKKLSARLMLLFCWVSQLSLLQMGQSKVLF